MDAPDPSVESEARLANVSFPVFQLRPQPSPNGLKQVRFTITARQ